MKTLLGGLFIGTSLYLIWSFILIQLMEPSEIRTFLSIVGGSIFGFAGIMFAAAQDWD